MNNLIKILVLILIVSSCKSTSNVKTPEKALDVNVPEKVMIIWTEMYRSVCCPRDPQHDNHILNYITEFEVENMVKINGTYKIVKGREGEASYYLTLNGLDAKQRKVFIENRYRNSSKKTKKIVLNLSENPVELEEIIKPWKLESVLKLN